jgi:hypothetical protein
LIFIRETNPHRQQSRGSHRPGAAYALLAGQPHGADSLTRVFRFDSMGFQPVGHGVAQVDGFAHAEVGGSVNVDAVDDEFRIVRGRRG